ncbi:MAG TPA: S-adenosyl-l-methionine hydroxide adenosyltransferase family protein [Acidobacteriota bacterium]|nr:S-adenosyl-l-methionine hydroxide adenosyltransferase family protein [Acidobacteriota bacterium]
MRRRLLLLIIFVLLLCRTGAAQNTVVFMTDFGVVDDSVTICKGVMLSIDPTLRIIDITHQVTPYSILDGARFLAGTTPYFPAGTVFVVVIDPGVGSTRKAMVVKSKRGQFFVLPDNGLITLVQDQDGIESAHEITNTSLMIGSKLSSTFHGRDIFSPVAAHLASGEDWTTVGPEMTTWVRLDIKPATLTANGISGEVIALDGPYGNIITNINADDFSKLEIERGTKIPIKLGPTTRIIPYVKTFSDVAVGQPLLYVDSRGHMALAINQGNFANAYHIKPPIPIEILKPTKSH